MSGDVQPRKRKDKKKKREDSVPPFVYVKDDPPVIVPSGNNGGHGGTGSAPSSDEQIHVYKESRLGGNICAKVIFFLLLATLTVMVGLIFTEYRGSSDVATAPDSPWSQMLEGWIDDSHLDKHDGHEKVDSGEHDDDEDHADHDEGGDELHDREDEEEHDDDEEEEQAVHEPEYETRSFSNVASELKVSEEEEDGEDGPDGSEDNDSEHEEGPVEDEGEEEREEDEEEVDNDDGGFQTSERHVELEDDEDEMAEENEENQDQTQSKEDQEQSNENNQEDNDISGEEEFVFREISGVTASTEETDENNEVDSAYGGIDQDEEDGINESKGQGSDAGYDSADEDGERDDDNFDADEEDNIEDYKENNGDDLNSEEEDGAENYDNIDLLQRIDEIRGEEENGQSNEQEEKDEGFEETSKPFDEYEEMGIAHDIDSVNTIPVLEMDDVSVEQQLESDDDFEEIEDSSEAGETPEGQEATESLEPAGDVRQPEQESDQEVSDAEEISGSEDEPPQIVRRTGGPKDAEQDSGWPMGPDYPSEKILTPERHREDRNFEALEAQLEENPEAVLKQVKSLLETMSKEPILLSLHAKSLDKLAELRHSNKFLEDAIAAYLHLLEIETVGDSLFIKTADRCINRMRFRGQHSQAVAVHKKLIARFPREPQYRNELTVTYLLSGRVTSAKHLLEETLALWPSNGFALVHYGFVLKTSENNYKDGAHLMQAGIDSNEPGTMDARFLFHLGDAYNRLGEHSRAEEVYVLGVTKGLFRSKYQRSLYNVDRLTARPWWTLTQTTHLEELRKFEKHWEEIRDEGMAVILSPNRTNSFKDEAENLRDKGDWKQLELYARGQQITSNCKRAPVTCKLIAQFPAAHSCRRGQAKFSVMQPNTHVWPHCGPTNCRLRAHLGLVVPPGTELRVGAEKRSWEEGKMLVFDDSFEHEVWHNGSSLRLVLIIDFWHPDLTEHERRSLSAI